MRKTSKNIPKGFDSWLEADLSEILKADYHVGKVPYVQYRNYEPDFVIFEAGTTIYLETKGRFRSKDEARKYVDVKASLPDDCELVFVFQRPHIAMPHAKKRKDGSYFRHQDWADKHGFRWYGPDTIPEEWKK